MAVNTAKQDFGVGTNDLYGVQEAERRRAAAKERAQKFQAMESQNILTEREAGHANSRARWAQTNKSAREDYEADKFDFAGATDLAAYYNDTAGAFSGGKRKNKFGKKDYEYLKKMGAKDDVINAHIAKLGFNQVHENFRNNELASHIHKNGWNSGSHFNQSDMNYLKNSGGNLVDEIFKHGDRKKGGYANMSGAAYKALKEAGRLEEFDAMYAKGHTKDLGITSYNQGKVWNGQDLGYLNRQGYGAEDIMKQMAATWHDTDEKKGAKVNLSVARWLKRKGLLDQYTQLTRGGGKSEPDVPSPNPIVVNESTTNTNQNSTQTQETTNTISNNLEQNIGNMGDITNTFGDGNTITGSNIGNNSSTNTGSMTVNNEISSQSNASNTFDLQGFRERLKNKKGLNFDQYKTNPYSFSGFDLNKYKNS